MLRRSKKVSNNLFDRFIITVIQEAKPNGSTKRWKTCSGSSVETLLLRLDKYLLKAAKVSETERLYEVEIKPWLCFISSWDFLCTFFEGDSNRGRRTRQARLSAWRKFQLHFFFFVTKWGVVLETSSLDSGHKERDFTTAFVVTFIFMALFACFTSQEWLKLKHFWGCAQINLGTFWFSGWKWWRLCLTKRENHWQAKFLNGWSCRL